MALQLAQRRLLRVSLRPLCNTCTRQEFLKLVDRFASLLSAQLLRKNAHWRVAEYQPRPFYPLRGPTYRRNLQHILT